MADETTSLSPLVADFILQIADFPGIGEKNSFVYASSVIAPSTNWPPEEFYDRLVHDLSHPRNIRALERGARARQSGSFQPYSITLTAINGDAIRFLAMPRPGKGADGKPLTMTALAPQPQEAFLSASETGAAASENRSFFRLLEFFPSYVVIIDKNHRMRFANRVARQLFGRADGKTCHQFFYGAEEPCSPCPPFGVFTEKVIKVHEWISTRTNTAFRVHSYPFDGPDGEPLILQVGINITAGIRARHALDLSEQRYRSIAENLTLGLALVDSKRSVITLNPRMEEWFGKKAMKGAFIDELLEHRCCGEDGVCLFDRVLTEKSNQEKDFPLTLPAGEERYFRLVACPILTRARQVRAIVIMLEDFTDRRNLASRMQQIQRLEALGSLAGGIAHEINQPLSALHLYASGMQMLVEKGAASPEQILERLSLILAQAGKIRQIISHMRALVLQEENPPASPVSITEVVAAAMNLVGAQLREHKITVVTDIPEDTPLVTANAVQLEQVVINLLVNAMHALDTLPDSPADGQDGTENGKQIRISAEKAGEAAVGLRITDTGPGLGRLHGRVFDPFFTTKGPNLGMGLGLSIVHAFVSSWGGSVEGSDNADKPGATFLVTLPVA